MIESRASVRYSTIATGDVNSNYQGEGGCAVQVQDVVDDGKQGKCT